MLLRTFLLLLIFAATISAIGARAAWKLAEPAQAERLLFRAAAPVIDIEARIQDLIAEVDTGDGTAATNAAAGEAAEEWRTLIAYGADRVADELELDEEVEAAMLRLVDEYDFAELTGGRPPALAVEDLEDVDWRAFTYYVLAESTGIISADAVTGIRTDAGEVRLDAVVERIIETLDRQGIDRIESIPAGEIDLLAQTAELLEALGTAPSGERTDAQEELADAAETAAELASGITEARRAAGIAAIAAAVAVLVLVVGLAFADGPARGIGFGALAVAAAAGLLAIAGAVVESQAPGRAAEAGEPVVESGWIIGEAAASALYGEAIIVLIAAASVAAVAAVSLAVAARRRATGG